MANPDKSNGYEEISEIFIAGRGRNEAGVGASTVAEWSQLLPARGAILDLGCGTGVPISRTLIERGFQVYGVDASPSVVAAFRERFPDVPVECAAVEESSFFDRTFDGVVAWGLFFLLTPEVQLQLIARIAAVLPVGGRLLFTAPREALSWQDAMTERPSISLGYDTYRESLEAEAMQLVGTYLDFGGNHHYSAQR